jgi:hypothetical protein
MNKNIFSPLVFLALLLALTVPATPASATTVKTHFTAVAVSLCFTAQPDPRCSFGEVTPLPNGKTIIHNFVNVVRLTAEDDRYTGTGIVTLKTLAPGSPQLFPFQGTWIFFPDNYDGYWEGVLSERVTQDGEYGEITAKGYGDLNGLILHDSIRGGLYHDVDILELR